MMPVIRLNDATFVDLKSIATWLGTTTPSKTIETLVKKEMEKLGLERDIEIEEGSVNEDGIVFETAPGLAFKRILSATVNHQKSMKMKWAGLLMKVIGIVKAKGLSGEQLVRELKIPAKAFEYTEEGFKFQPDLGISIQGQSARDAWKEISRLAQKYHIPVEIRFQWKENEKAQYPGKIGVIRAGL
jgi:hypothetical protein